EGAREQRGLCLILAAIGAATQMAGEFGPFPGRQLIIELQLDVLACCLAVHRSFPNESGQRRRSVSRTLSRARCTRKRSVAGRASRTAAICSYVIPSRSRSTT